MMEVIDEAAAKIVLAMDDGDSLDSLFRLDAQPRTTVTLDTDGVEVELWTNGGVEICVTDRAVE